MNITKNTKMIWDYMHLNMALIKAEAILISCSFDTRIANYGAKLFHDGYAPVIITSGGAGRITEYLFDKPEALVYKDILMQAGVPEDCIIVEAESTNTGENYMFTYEALHTLKQKYNSIILLQSSYMERRNYATFKKQWPDDLVEICVTSPDMSYEDYMSDSLLGETEEINVMLGDLQRIREYPKLGYQIEQDIPSNVWQAYEELVGAGYTNHLL